MAKKRFSDNYSGWWNKVLTNPETKDKATSSRPFNTDSGEYYVRTTRFHGRSAIKKKWMDITPYSMGLPNEYEFRASDSQTYRDQIDLKIAESKDPRVNSFYNFHLNCRYLDE